MSSGMKKEGIILILTLFLMLFSVSVFAQTTGQCCILSDGFCSNDYSKAQCDGLSPAGIFYDTLCLDQFECRPVCCELGGTFAQFNFAAQCTSLSQKGEVSTTYTYDTCPVSSSEILITGKVIYSDVAITPVSGATVLIYNSTWQKTGNSANDGIFNLYVSKSQNYMLNASLSGRPECISAPQQVIVGTTSPQDVGNIMLQCGSTVPVCVSTWNIGPWSSGTCGIRTVTELAPKCTVPNNIPISFMPCDQTGECGNGKIEVGEDCDFGPPAIFSSSFDNCNDFDGNFKGTVACSYDCKTINDCVKCDGNINSCNDVKMCDLCGSQCTNTPLCTDSCKNSDKIIPFGAVGTYNSQYGKGIKISWELEEPLCNVGIINLTRCVEDPKNPRTCKSNSKIIASNLDGTTTFFEDYFLPQVTAQNKNDTYCYNISLAINNGMDIIKITDSGLACSKTWDDECLENPNGYHCSGDRRVLCENGVLNLDPDQTKDCGVCGCRQATPDTEAECVPQEACNQCDQCSGPFGLFAYRDYTFPPNTASNAQDWAATCSAINSKNMYCYADDYSKNKAIIGTTHVCSEIKSCYDYKTSLSCQGKDPSDPQDPSRNPCNLANANDCKWKSFSNEDELGIGVCVPTKVEDQDCSKCDNLGTFGNYCPEEFCMLFGTNGTDSTCYYNYNKKISYDKLKIDNATCMNKKDVACETYDSKNACIGTNDVQFAAHVGYDGEGNRIGYTNFITTLSNDSLGRGKCIWVESDSINPGFGECIRDADYSSLTSFESGKAIEIPGDGCSKSKGSESCYTDFENPATNLTIRGEVVLDESEYSKAELQLLTISTSEIATKTYFSTKYKSITPTVKAKSVPIINEPPKPVTFSPYPNYTLDVFKGKIINNLVPGDYAIYYYSEDKSKNLEQVKSLQFTLLKDLSGIDVKYELASASYQSLDTYLTNLTVSIVYDDDLQCKVSLIDLLNPSKIFSANSLKMSPGLVWNYEYLPDGEYLIKTTCTDDHFQQFVNSTPVHVEADITMHDVYPKGKTFRASQIKLGLQTSTDATCYYTKDALATKPNLPTQTPNLVYWKKYSNTGKTVHDSTIREPITSMNYIYTACLFSYTNGTTEWNFWNGGDVIYYAIDESAPTFEINDISTGEAYNNSIASEGLAIQISCTDYNKLLENGKSYSFGCDNAATFNKYYASTTNINQILKVFPSSAILLTDVIEVPAPDIYSKVFLNITVKDLGGNNFTGKVFLNIRNLSFINPIVIICNPDTGICT